MQHLRTLLPAFAALFFLLTACENDSPETWDCEATYRNYLSAKAELCNALWVRDTMVDRYNRQLKDGDPNTPTKVFQDSVFAADVNATDRMVEFVVFEQNLNRVRCPQNQDTLGCDIVIGNDSVSIALSLAQPPIEDANQEIN